MNAQMKQHLATVIDTLVESDVNGATAAFHEYIRLKSKAILMGESVEGEECSDEDKKDEPSDDEADEADDKKKDKTSDKDED